MAKGRKKKSVELEEELVISEGGGIKSGIIAVLALSIAAILILALVGRAGTAGETVDYWLAQALGMTRFVAPLYLLAYGADLLVRDQKYVNLKSSLALLLAVCGINGLLNLLFYSSDNGSGGWLGLIFSQGVAGAFGSLAAGILAFSALVVGVIIITNLSLREFIRAHFGRFNSEIDAREEEFEQEEDRSRPTKKRFEEVSEEEEEDSEEEEIREAEEAAEREQKGKLARAAAMFGIGANKPADEAILASVAPRRNIEIPLDLLENVRSEAKPGDMNRNQEIISKTLRQFGIDVEMSDVKVGPTVTQYAFRPAQGVKLARVVALQNDLALALAAHPIRIEAPIPGKALVGVEVPNQTAARVSLRELLEADEFQKRKTSFMVPLGKDISGGVPLLSVERAPHMLVAGATGSGKSVCLNTIILSLLYQNGPDDLKLIMVDPKRVELGVYAGIPHLLVPPIVKAEEAVNALKWAVREMDRRLDHLAKFGAREIDAYNAKAADKLPRIIVVIDELADLMIQNKREVEATIVRIAQMARAAGIHLILATQRPSVDVITGTIKANIPTRLAFAVASQVDSKTILDIAGAEKLLGRGDMLLSNAELSKPKRIQGAFVSDGEIERVVEFLKKQSVPEYNHAIIEGTRGGDSGGVALGGASSDEPLLEEGIEVAIEAGKISTSLLQRRLKIGYGRAARMLDLLEEMGIVGGADGAKPREVLVSQWPPAGEESFDSEDVDDADSQLEEEEEIEDVPEEDYNEDEEGKG